MGLSSLAPLIFYPELVEGKGEGWGRGSSIVPRSSFTVPRSSFNVHRSNVHRAKLSKIIHFFHKFLAI